MTLYYDQIDTPIGTMFVVSNGKAIVRIDYGSLHSMNNKLASWLKRYFPDSRLVHSPEQVKQAKYELLEYFQGTRKTFSFPFSFYGTPFQTQVWQALFNLLPYGETTAYKDIAQAIGNPKAVRAVGGAVNKNPISIVVPCHRVVGANGKMVGYGGGLDKKEFLLALEKNHE
ncbi:methylated-DNA--[protein]-cysteine S-methyltransferase [Lentibacillus cibarius]|uniref:Methylated-DNA--protein-cysteine methyltransferase n=1 Tax=Lentibacillus cibarius TaxID=2583219 RepID=A0A549YIV1_9BACI|nr:methylated-DNA--[protein]-cysteine S-methyltransferase [Lentibacillus cibarius]TRM11800.1 methylated-DNA--[protein]-cysteine S-methyltransferase [Lentibacillus cibarius]